jgi:hypothetical protein
VSDYLHTDSAGNVRSEEQVHAIAERTAAQMTWREIFRDLVEECGGYASGLPEAYTRCDCHGLWYDECEMYR